MPPVSDPDDDPPPARRADAVHARFGAPAFRLPPSLSAPLPFALPALVLGFFTIRGVYAKLGHPGATLDDSFIHFQYARAIAEGHPFRYQAGEPATMGGTSALWPLLLAPFYAIGFTGLSILWPAWLISFAALGFLARETYLLAYPLTGKVAASGVGAMVFAFSPFTWCAGSGMEVIPFAFCLVRAVRRSSEWVEASESTVAVERELLALAFLAPLFRPEGALASVVIAVAFVMGPRSSRSRAFTCAAVALLAAITPQLLSVLVTGTLRSNTAQVKLLPGNPYFTGAALRDAILENVALLGRTLLNGEAWSAEFIPHGSMPFTLAGLIAIVSCGRRRSRLFRATAVLALACAIAVPAAYISFLWNRLRYLWPFAPFWLIGIGCLARVLGEDLGKLRARWRLVTPLLAWGIAGLLAAKLEGTIDDVANCASGIDRQQVALGRWAKDAIPKGARIGVNDTGAIAYFGDHATFDVVGLTTRHEGHYWVAGAASRFEHYEHLAATPDVLPSYFIVYPGWMAMEPVLGPPIHEATVLDSTILGGTTMAVYPADYSRLGSGERAWTSGSATVTDSLDVADLDSEEAHAYELLGAHDGEEVLTEGVTPTGLTIVDGGRSARFHERFQVALGGKASRGIVRLTASEATRVHVLLDGHEVTNFPALPGDWTEASFTLLAASARPTVELVPDAGSLTTYHYWFQAI